MRFIVIECANEYVKGAGVPIGAAGSYSDVALKIKFSDMWDGMSKHITWLDANGENPTIVYLTAQNYDGEYYTSLIPAEAKAVAGTAVMSIKGADSSKGTLTAKAEFKVLESVYDENAEESVDPTPTVAEQLQEQVESILGTISDARNAATEAAASAGAAYDSQVAAAGSESAAGGYAIEARSYAKGDTNTRTGEATDNAKYYKEQAASSASAAAGYESDSEAYAKGTRAGTAVGSTDPAYQNNSKYYSEQAAGSATIAGLAETAASGYASTALGYKNDAGGYASDAAGSATDAAGSASDASDSATAAAGSASDAADSALAASGSASAASGSASAADASATEAESYAKGGTSSRTGEDADNAKYYKEQAASSASTASVAESAAASSASDAEAAAKGTRNGSDVSSSDPFYHANAKYYRGEAADSATSASGSASDALGYKNAASGSAAAAAGSAIAAESYAKGGTNSRSGENTDNAKYYSEQASSSATSASGSASAAGTCASDAEAAARGTRNGVAVTSSDEFYHDNAKYWRDQASEIVGPAQAKITATGILKGEGDGVVTAAVAGTDYDVPEIFVAVYNSTTYADALAAYNAGKLLVCENGTYTVPLSDYSGSTFRFYYFRNGSAGGYYLDSSGWSGGSLSYVSTGRKINNKALTSDITLAASDVGAQAKITASGLLKGDGDGGVTAATSGTDYQAAGDYMVRGTDYVTAGQKSGTTLGTKVTAEGYDTASIGEYSHSEGDEGYAIGAASHIEGRGAAGNNTFSTITVTGDANTKVYTIPSSASFPDLYSIVRYGNNYAYIKELDYENDQFTISAAISATALSNESIDYLPSGISFNTLRLTKGNGPKLTFGIGSHSEGIGTMSIGSAGHAEGYRSASIGNYAHAEGSATVAVGNLSHTEGGQNTAFGSASHVEGQYNVSRARLQHVFGMWNAPDEYSCSAYELPKGRMRGDVNGDGRITATDSEIIVDYINGGAQLDTIATWCADVNNNSLIANNDSVQIDRYLNGLSNALTGVPTLADYYNNWTYVKVGDITGYWTCDITITDDASDISNVKCHNLISYSVSGTTLTVNVSVPPIKESIVLVVKNSYVSGTVIGENIEIVGNGTANGKEANARTLDWLGNETLAGKLTVGADPTNNMDVATKQYVDGAIPSVPSGSSTSPAMDGTAAAGTETTWAHGDHVHPTDTSRQAKITATGILKGDGAGGVTAAVAGTDYAAASHNHDASDITSGTLGVARGGTGAASFTANSVVMSGSSTTAALTTRAVTNNTSSTALAANDNIPTQNTVYYGLNHRLNRTTAVNAADTGYTTYMARGEALNSADTNPSVNGAISWTYA